MDKNGYDFIIMVKGCKELVNKYVLANKGTFMFQRSILLSYFLRCKGQTPLSFYKIRSVGAGVFGIYVTALLYITLFMRYVGMRREIDLIPFHFIKTYQRDFVLFVENIILFIPLGMFLQAYKKNTKFTIGCAIVISLMIELLQYVFCCGKTEVDDVMANVIGAIIGYIIIKIMTKG